MHVYLLPTSPHLLLSLLWWGAEEGEEEKAGLSVIVPGGELAKLGHGYSPAPLFPLETLWICTLAGNPTGLCSFSISALYSFSISAHFSFCLFQRHAFIVASHSCFSQCLLFPPLSQSVGMIFCWILIQTSFIVSLLPQRLYIQYYVSLQYCLSAPRAAVTPFSSSLPQLHVCCSFSSPQGGPDAP